MVAVAHAPWKSTTHLDATVPCWIAGQVIQKDDTLAGQDREGPVVVENRRPAHEAQLAARDQRIGTAEVVVTAGNRVRNPSWQGTLGAGFLQH